MALRSPRRPDGTENGFRGTYREVTPPERLVYTFEWEGMPGHVLVEAITFEEHGGGTKITPVSPFHTPEERDGMLASGMERAPTSRLDQLEELLAQSRRARSSPSMSFGCSRTSP